jgi:hypothetical protein
MSRFLDELASAIGKPGDSFELVGLEQTDELLAKFREATATLNDSPSVMLKVTYPVSAIRVLEHDLELLKSVKTKYQMVLFRPLSAYCGAVRINSEELFEHALKLVDVDEIVVGMSEDASHGIILEFCTVWLISDEDAEYDLRLWGTDWMAALSAASY